MQSPQLQRLLGIKSKGDESLQHCQCAAIMQSNYTREHSEATQALLKGFVGDIIEGVASSRGLPQAEVSHVLLASLSQCSHG